jgi:S1-C subfamily serine protease
MSTFYDYPPRQRPPGCLSFWPWLFVFASLGVLLWYYWPHNHEPGAVDITLREVAPRDGYLPEELANRQVYEKDKDSVVGIDSFTLRRRLGSRNVTEIPEGSGSGFIWDARGFIVTNYHVIQNADAAEVHLADGSTFTAKLWGAAPDHDLAVLRIEAPEGTLKPITVGTSKDLWVGQKVWAIGNPFGVGQSLTTGIISALNREIQSVTNQPISGVIQTDASINPGNSGGPLLDSAGRLIGVNTAIASPSGGSTGVGFAIPIDTVNRVVTQLISDRKVVRAGLGVQLSADPAARAAGRAGALVANVLARGPAAQAGIHSADLIVAINDKPVSSNKQLFQLLAEHKAGDKVKVSVQRGDERLDIPVTLAPL